MRLCAIKTAVVQQNEFIGDESLGIFIKQNFHYSVGSSDETSFWPRNLALLRCSPSRNASDAMTRAVLIG